MKTLEYINEPGKPDHLQAASDNKYRVFLLLTPQSLSRFSSGYFEFLPQKLKNMVFPEVIRFRQSLDSHFPVLERVAEIEQ